MKREEDPALVASSLTTLLTGLIDYAGLFPPAALDMEATVKNYAAHRKGEFAWMLGKLIVPIGRIDEFLQTAQTHFSTSERHWSLSVLVGASLDAVTSFTFPSRDAGWRVDALEFKAETADFIAAAAAAIPSDLLPHAFFELPVTSELPTLVRAIKNVGACAKIRTGGITADAFPSAKQIARFLETCVEFGVPCKATAGLHHPLRSVNRLTYEPQCASSLMHGFLNVFVTAAFLLQGMTTDNALKVLEERDAENFHFTDGGLAWHCQELSLAQLAQARNDFCLSFGSCSFEEPVDDLQKLKLL